MTVRRAGSSALISVTPATESAGDQVRFTEPDDAVAFVAGWLAEQVAELGSS